MFKTPHKQLNIALREPH